MQRPSRRALCQFRERAFVAEVAAELSGKFPRLLFVEKPIGRDEFLEEEDFAVDSHQPRAAGSRNLYDFNEEILVVWSLH